MGRSVKKNLLDILFRYAILVFLSIFGLSIFYFIFTPLTLYPSYLLFKIFYPVIIINSDIIKFLNLPLSLEIIGACVGGSAYTLLFILNLSTPNIKLKKRLTMIGISIFVFLIANILRIFLVGVLFAENVKFANSVHEFLWYFGSIFLLIIIWFFEVRKFKIKEIPFYSDIKFFAKYIKKD